MKYIFKEKIDLIKYQFKYHIILSRAQKESIVNVWRNPIPDEKWEEIKAELEEYYKDREITPDYIEKHAGEFSIDKKDLKILKKCQGLKHEEALKYRAVFTKYFGDRFVGEYDCFLVWK